MKWETTAATARATAGRCVLRVHRAHWRGPGDTARFEWWVGPAPVPGTVYTGGTIADGRTTTKTQAKRAAEAVAAGERCRG